MPGHRTMQPCIPLDETESRSMPRCAATVYVKNACRLCAESLSETLCLALCPTALPQPWCAPHVHTDLNHRRAMHLPLALDDDAACCGWLHKTVRI